MTNYLSGVLSTQKTPQSEPIPGSDQTANSAGGYSFAVDDWKRLTRFLVLGAEGGSYYASEKALSKENAQAVLRCIQADGVRTVNEIVAVSDAGRAPKNDPALFALAMASRLGDLATKKAAFQALPKVARIGTHLFHFVAFMEQFGRWGVLPRRGVAAWYEQRPIASLAEQAVKYQARDGWGHADLIRLAHPRANGDEAREAVYRYMSYGMEPDHDKRGTKVKGYMPETRFRQVLGAELVESLQIIRGTEEIKTAATALDVAALISRYKLPREVVPTNWLDDKLVWSVLLADMGLTAMIRNLGKMTSIGLMTPTGAAVVVSRLNDQEALRKARVHPITILLALLTYKGGHGIKGSLKWEPVTAIVDALDKAFYLAFQNVEPSNVAWEMWLDISGSMNGGAVAGIEGFTPRHASAAFALINASVEPQCEFYAFTKDSRKLTISPRQRLDDVYGESSALAQYMGGTDCAQPMIHALAAGRKVDVFCVLTDSETWAGAIHPTQALAEYRAKINPKAKLIVVGFVSNGFSIADPKDAGMMDFVGMDASAPALMSEFAAGRL